jgi:hypothetical protein
VSEVFLGIIAISVLVMALIQVGALVAALRVAKRLEQVSRQIETDIKPLITNLGAVTAELSRTAGVAARQMDRVDRLFGDLATRVEQTLAVAQQFVHGPARNGFAILSGVQAAVSAFKGIREASRRRHKVTPGVEDDSLFIG